MIPDRIAKRIEADDRESPKCFIVTGEDTRQCLICDRVLSKRESFEHSKTICYPPASTMN